MRDHRDLGVERRDATRDLIVGQMVTGGVDQADLMAGVEQWAANHEQAQGHLVPDTQVADRGFEGTVD